MRSCTLLFLTIIMLPVPVACHSRGQAMVRDEDIAQHRPVLAEDTAAEDKSAIGMDYWIAYPRGEFSFEPFTLRHSSTEAVISNPVPIGQARPSDVVVTGTAAEILHAVESLDGVPVPAMRIIGGNSFDDWHSVIQLRNGLKARGWREVSDRPGLWIAPRDNVD